MWHAGNLPDYRNYGLGRSQEGATNYNLNNITETSILGINNTTTSTPSGMEYGSVWTHRKGATEFTQLVVDVITGQSYTRGWSSGFGDTGWRKGWDSVNLPNPVDQSQLSNYVTIHTPQTIIADKTFAPTSQVSFYGNDGSVVKVLRKSSGTTEVVAGHEYCFYDTRWKVGNKRGGGANTLGFTFNVSGNDGATYDEIVLIQSDGNILTSNFGAASDWNAKVSQSQLSGYVNKSGDTMTGTLNALTISAQNGADKLIYDNIENFGSTLKINANASLGIQLQSNNNTKVLIDEGGISLYGNVNTTGSLNINSNSEIGRWKGADNNTNYLIWRNYTDTKDIAYIGADGNSAASGGGGDGFAIVAPSGRLQLNAQEGVLINGNAPWTAGNLDPNTYLSKSGGTLTEGGRISAQGTITIQQVDTFNATGLFWETMANSDNMAGIGALTTGDTLHGVYMGWGSLPWQPQHSLSVSIDYIKYKGFDIWHAGSFNPDLYLTQRGGYHTALIAKTDFPLSITDYTGDPSTTGFQSYFGTSFHFKGPNSWYNRLDFPTNAEKLFLYQGINTTDMTLRGYIPVLNGNVTNWDSGNFNPNAKVNKAGDTMTGGLVIDTLDAVGSNDLGVLPTNYKLFLANNGSKYGTVHWVEGNGQGYIQQQRADGNPIAYRLNLQPYGGELFYGNSEVATTNYVQNVIGSRVIAENGASALGFVGGTAVTPYVKHSNGTEVNIASQNWVNENKFVRANIPFDNSLGRNVFLSDNYFGGETGLYDKNNDHIIAGWFNNLYYYGADVNGGSNSSGIFMDYNTGHHGYRSTPNPNYFHYFNGNMQVNDNVTAQGFIKNNSSDDYFLMGGGGQLTKYSKDDSYVNSHRDFPDGTLITTNIDYSHSAGDSFLLEIKGNMYGGGLPMDTKVQGYIYADTIINQSGYSTYADLTTIIAMNINGNLCFWFPRLWYWQGFSVKVIATGGGGITTVNRVISIDNSAEPVGTKQVKIAIYTLSTQSWVNNQGFLTSANLNGYVTQSALNTQLGSYATLNGVQTFNNTNTFNQSPVIPNGTLGNHAVNLNQLLDVAPPYHWNYVGQPAITNRRVLREMTWNNYGNGHTLFDISSGTTPWGASKSNVDAEQKWTPSYPTLVGGNGSETYGVRVDSARNADNLGGVPAGNYATQTWVNTNFIPTSHPVYNITQANINSWNAGTGGGSSHTHFNLSYLNNIDQYLGTGQAPQFGSIRLMDSLGYGLLALGEDFIGGEVGLVDLSNDRFYAGRINEYLKYGSSVNGFEGLNIHFDAKLLGIGREIGNDEDKVQLAGDLSVDTVDFDHNSRQLVLNPLYNADGDVRRSRNAHIYIVTRNPVRLPDKPILGQRIEIFNDSDSDIEVTHGNVGTMFKVPAFCKITGIAANKGFRFDAEPIRTKQYDI
jgi:hypothetical protein